MPEDKIRQIVRQEIGKANNKDTFTATNQGTKHIHNGTDMPFAFSPVQTYIAEISFSFISGISFSTLPTGWAIVWNGGGNFVLTHNLNSDFYAVAATCSNSNTGFPVVSMTVDANKVTFDWADSATQGALDTDFHVILTQINNKKITPPTYVEPRTI